MECRRLRCAELVDTAPPLFEFYVFLVPRDDAAVAAESWRTVHGTLHDPLPGSAEEHAIHEQQAKRQQDALREA